MCESIDQTIRFVGRDSFLFEPVPDWAQLPEGWKFNEAVAVAVDSQDRVFVFSRSEHPVMIFDRDGIFLNAWGEGLFERPHGLLIGPDDSVFCIDDVGHAIYRFTPDGELLATMGTPGKCSDTGVVNGDYRTLKQPAGPFNLPTNLALGANGEIYVADGYGNARIHRFSADGELLDSWGKPGSGPGEFAVPHDVAVRSDGTVFVCDRENSRIQLFSPEGEFLSEWTTPARPCQVVFDKQNNGFVAELGLQVGYYLDHDYPGRERIPSRVGVYDPNGELLTTWGHGDYGVPGELYAAHGIALDSHGDIYVGEVRPSMYGATDGAKPPWPLPPADAPVLQKFVRCD